ncbi:MAG: DUF1080 domain-containing protein [Petrimonas sp.]|nr:DUF1080 domain-containing protein [Petrimonas sp.]
MKATRSITRFLAVTGFLSLILLLQNCTNSSSEKGFRPIFDGKTLTGWQGDSTYWRVENGTLVGEITPQTVLKRNSFIIWRGGTPSDFELKLEYRITKDGNSGINYRSEEVPGTPYALKGYQFDIDGNNRYTGQNYEERGRTTLAYHGQKVVLNPLPDSLANLPVSDLVRNNAWTQAVVTDSLGNEEELKSHIKDNDWNECHLIVKGNHYQHFVNGVLMSDVTDNDTKNRKTSGLIGVQVHVGPPMKVEFRNIRIKK